MNVNLTLTGISIVYRYTFVDTYECRDLREACTKHGGVSSTNMAPVWVFGQSQGRLAPVLQGQRLRMNGPGGLDG